MTDKKNEEMIEELLENVKRIYSKLVEEEEDDDQEEEEEDAKKSIEASVLALKMKKEIFPLLSRDENLNVFALMRLSTSYANCIGISRKDCLECYEGVLDYEMIQCKKNKSKMDKIKEILKGDG